MICCCLLGCSHQLLFNLPTMNEKSNYFTNTFPAGREASEMYYQLQQRAALRLPEITLLLSKLDTNTKKKAGRLPHRGKREMGSLLLPESSNRFCFVPKSSRQITRYRCYSLPPTIPPPLPQELKPPATSRFSWDTFGMLHGLRASGRWAVCSALTPRPCQVLSHHTHPSPLLDWGGGVGREGVYWHPESFCSLSTPPTLGFGD